MNRNIIFAALFSLLFLAACGSSSTATSTEEDMTVITQEVQKLDSISAEMDNISTEIEENAKALEAALSELGEE